MRRVKIKICGLTRNEDLEAAIAAGADAVGFVFTSSPRRISTDTAIRLCSYVPEDVLRVGLFLDQDGSEIERVVKSVPLDVLQFHGSETEQECSVFGLPWLKAVGDGKCTLGTSSGTRLSGCYGLVAGQSCERQTWRQRQGI